MYDNDLKLFGYRIGFKKSISESFFMTHYTLLAINPKKVLILQKMRLEV